MAKENEIILASGYFDGYKTKSNYDVEISFKFTEESLSNALQFIAGIGKRVAILAQVQDSEFFKLGTFNVYDFKVDRNANTKIRFKTGMENCFVNNFSSLITDEEVVVNLKAKVVD